MDLTPIQDWIFDLDNTLYRADSHFFSQIDYKMTDFISRYLNVTTDVAATLRKEYWVQYGTTLSGMIAVHDMDPAEFLEYVHDVDLSFLSPDPALRDIIQNLPGRKFIFTNGPKAHARNVAGHLNLWDLFDDSFGIEDANYIPKPKKDPYDIFCARFNIATDRAIMFEDNVSNLEVPRALGMKTVLISSHEDWSHIPQDKRPAHVSARPDWVDAVTPDLAIWLQSHSQTTVNLPKRRGHDKI